MEYQRRPQDVVGENEALLRYWGTMPRNVQAQLLNSGITVDTLGELQLLRGHMEHDL